MLIEVLTMSEQSQQNKYKKGLDSTATRRRRGEISVQLRKSKKEEWLDKKRKQGVVVVDETADVLQQALSQMPLWRDMVLQGSMEEAIEGTREFRRILSIEKDPPIDEVIELGIVPRLIEFLQLAESVKIQFEASWAITNIASGTSEQTRVVVESGAVPHLVSLLRSSSPEIQEQCVWALGNIAGDSIDYRNMVLGYGALEPMAMILSETQEPTLIRNTTWAVSNLSRGRPQPDWNWVKAALPPLSRLLYTPDEDILIDTCWAISYLSDGPGPRIAEIIDSGIVRRLVQLLMHNHPSVQTPALRTIGNIVTGDDDQTQHCLALGVLHSLLALLSHPKRNIRKEACWTISNITAGNEHQIQQVIEANIMPPVVQLLQTCSDFAIRKEACWAVSNATTDANTDQIDYFVKLGCIPPLCEFLQAADVRLVMVALEAIENILEAGEEIARNGKSSVNEYAVFVEECKGLEKIFKLQHHTNASIYDKAVEIIDSFFSTPEDEGAPEIAPTTQNGSFGFGLQTPGKFSFSRR